jgi:hypothetical protein
MKSLRIYWWENLFISLWKAKFACGSHVYKRLYFVLITIFGKFHESFLSQKYMHRIFPTQSIFHSHDCEEHKTRHILLWLWRIKRCFVYMLRSSRKKAQWAKKQPERVLAISKEPRHEISGRACFVTATTRSGMSRNATMRNSCRGC